MTKKMHDGECEYCLIPDKSKWVTNCLYKGHWPSHKAFVRSTFDPPCALDAYDDDQAELIERRRYDFYNLMFGLVGLIFVGWCLFAR